MSLRTILRTLSCAIMWLCIAATTGHTDGGIPDHGSQDRYRACNHPDWGRQLNPVDRRNAVFAIWVTRHSGPERTGTATLIDDTGVFLAAAHSVVFDKTHPIKITQYFGGVPRSFPVILASSADNFQNEDYVLLEAKGWDKGERYPYPLRFDDIGFANGEFW